MPEPAKKKRGRKKLVRSECKIVCENLRWPEGYAVVDADKRVKGSYQISYTDAMKREGRTRRGQASTAFKKRMNSMNIPKAVISWDCHSDPEAVDEAHPDPRVAIYFWYNNKMRTMACSHYTTIVGNFRACIDAITGFFFLDKANCIHDYTMEMARFSSVIARPIVQIAASLAHLNFKDDHRKIFSIKDSDMDWKRGMPQRAVLVERRRALSSIYHPDHETSPKDGSFEVMQNSFEYCMAEIEKIDAMHAKQEEQKRLAAEAAEERRKAAEAGEVPDEAEKPAEVTEEPCSEPEEVAADPEPASEENNLNTWSDIIGAAKSEEDEESDDTEEPAEEEAEEELVPHEWGQNGSKPNCTYCDVQRDESTENEHCQYRADDLAYSQEVDDAEIDSQDQESDDEDDDNQIEDMMREEYDKGE